MDELKNIRWRQRYSNLVKAFRQLEKGVLLESPNEIEIQGIIQSFEFTFELCWKTLRDYLESQGIATAFPREVIKQAYRYNLLSNGELWLEMLSKRNLLAHTYDEKLAKEAYDLITKQYFSSIRQLVLLLGTFADE